MAKNQKKFNTDNNDNIVFNEIEQLNDDNARGVAITPTTSINLYKRINRRTSAIKI